MRGRKVFIPLFLLCSVAFPSESSLPFSHVFSGQALVRTRYKNFPLEIDNRIESPSVNFQGMDCWTFFEIALSFARMLNEPESNWTPERLLHYIEIDRYRGGECTGEYFSRLHYLE